MYNMFVIFGSVWHLYIYLKEQRFQLSNLSPINQDETTTLYSRAIRQDIVIMV